MVDYTGCLSALQTVVTTRQGGNHPAAGRGQPQRRFPKDTGVSPVPKRCKIREGQRQPRQLPLGQAGTGRDRQPPTLLPPHTHPARLLPAVHRLDTSKHKQISGKITPNLSKGWSICTPGGSQQENPPFFSALLDLIYKARPETSSRSIHLNCCCRTKFTLRKSNSGSACPPPARSCGEETKRCDSPSESSQRFSP